MAFWAFGLDLIFSTSKILICVPFFLQYRSRYPKFKKQIKEHEKH